MARVVATRAKHVPGMCGNAEMLDIAGDEDAERVTHARTPGQRFIANKTPGIVHTPGMSQLFMTPFPATQRTGRSRAQPVSFDTPIIVPTRGKCTISKQCRALLACNAGASRRPTLPSMHRCEPAMKRDNALCRLVYSASVAKHIIYQTSCLFLRLFKVGMRRVPKSSFTFITPLRLRYTAMRST